MTIEQMIKSVRMFLSHFGCVDERILIAMKKIDRKRFVSEKFRDNAYIDTALGIEHGQTISQPSTVARMLSLLELKKEDNVLEIGAGSGWNAALIAEIVSKGKVLSLELYGDLVDSAKKRILSIGLRNVDIQKKDFRIVNKKFDKIIFTAGILPDEEGMIVNYAKKHLNENGILVCSLRVGHLIILKKVNENIEASYTDEEYVFVPLVL